MNSLEIESVCRVCGGGNLSALYESMGDYSFTSSQTALPLKIRVAFCRTCGHAQTPPLENITEYYDTSYNFRNKDVDEDDIYSVIEGKITYRSDHQAAILEEKLDFSRPLRVLDYGCGKASTLRKLTVRHPNIIPYTFDVSEAYVDSWEKFVETKHQASYEAPCEWNGQLDLVVSLFALEHVDDPRALLQALRRLLHAKGKVHLIVPHLYRNASDLLVADHVNHFSVSSLHRLFRDAGFKGITIDSESHCAALIVNATLDQSASASDSISTEKVVETAVQARRIAAQWLESADKIRDYQCSQRGRKTAIYGSGVYGLFIASTLTTLDNIAYFVDMNPFRQGLVLLNRPVIAPRALEKDVEVVLVGLNPQDARQIVEQSPWLHTVDRDFVYL